MLLQWNVVDPVQLDWQTAVSLERCAFQRIVALGVACVCAKVVFPDGCRMLLAFLVSWVTDFLGCAIG